MLHDAESELHQKLLIVNSFPGRYLIINILEIRNGTRQVKYFFGPPFNEELFGIYR